MKALLIFVGAMGLEFTGLKIYSIDVEQYLGQITAAQAYNWYYIMLCLAHGFFMASTLWRLFEMYWWAKDQVARIRGGSCEGRDIDLHTGIEVTMNNSECEVKIHG